MTRKYDESSVKVLKGLEAVRKKTAMYIGNPDSHGLFTIAREPADNFVDEALAHRCKKGYIKINSKTKELWVYDDGQGIPVGKHKTEKVSTLEVVTGMLHGGGKDSDAYEASRGTHGIGIKCSNALSTQFIVATCRDGVWHIVEYQKGVKQYDTRKATRAEVNALGSPFKKGTALYAKADMSIFDKGSKFDIEMFQEWCEIAAYFTPKLSITLDFDGEIEEYHFPNGMQDWFDDYIEESGASVIGKPFEFRTSAADIVVTWTDAESSELYGYTNGLYQVDGGTHINTFTDCIRDTLKEYAGARDSFTKEELCEGLLGAINFKINAPRFSSQTKEKLTDVRFTEMVKEELIEAFQTFWSKNKGMAREILKRATALRKFKQSVQLDRKALLELKQRKKTGVLPTKMATVRGITAEQREIFLVEGDSAGGSAKQARMKTPFRYQEVLALKGKVTNAMKATLPKLMASEEVLNTLTGIGYDPEAADPISKLRAHKIIMLSDPDPDGYHINALILALLAKLIPKAFDLGYVYALVSPKLVLNHNGHQYMAMTKEELAAMLPKGVDPGRATYLKGWGEATVPLMRSIAFDPSKRRLLQIAKPTAKDLKEFEALMGDSPEYRKKLLGI